MIRTVILYTQADGNSIQFFECANPRRLVQWLRTWGSDMDAIRVLVEVRTERQIDRLADGAPFPSPDGIWSAQNQRDRDTAPGV